MEHRDLLQYLSISAIVERIRMVPRSMQPKDVNQKEKILMFSAEKMRISPLCTWKVKVFELADFIFYFTSLFFSGLFTYVRAYLKDLVHRVM